MAPEATKKKKKNGRRWEHPTRAAQGRPASTIRQGALDAAAPWPASSRARLPRRRPGPDGDPQDGATPGSRDAPRVADAPAGAPQRGGVPHANHINEASTAAAHTSPPRAGTPHRQTGRAWRARQRIGAFRTWRDATQPPLGKAQASAASRSRLANQTGPPLLDKLELIMVPPLSRPSRERRRTMVAPTHTG